MDHILYWNSIALEANRQDFSNLGNGDQRKPEQPGPTLSSRALAIVHLAMYDAHAGVVNSEDLPRYLAWPGSPAPGASAAAAVAAAAHACLSTLFPRQQAMFDLALKNAGLNGGGLAEGHAFGLAVAQSMLCDRQADPDASDTGYQPPTTRFAHRPDPSNPDQGFHAPFYGKRSKCFAVSTRHVIEPPPTHGRPEYERAIRQVRGKGILPERMGTLPSSSTPRTANETLTGLFWAYDGAREIGTPPRLYNQIARAVAEQHGNDVNANARLFALINAAMGDAGILAWEQKYFHNLWRPVLGIREHDTSMGPSAQPEDRKDNLNDDCDPDWLPLGAPASNSSERNATPNFPAYPSGHATFGAAALHMIRLFYGITPGHHSADTIFHGPVISDELNGHTRDQQGTVRSRHVRAFPGGLWQMIEENGFSRVYLGVHWFFDAFALDANGQPDLTLNIGGVPLGLAIAEDIFAQAEGKGPVKSNK